MKHGETSLCLLGSTSTAPDIWLLQALFDLEATNQELKSDLRDLYITGAAEIDVGSSSRKAIIIHVRLLSSMLSASGLSAWHTPFMHFLMESMAYLFIASTRESGLP